MSKKDNLLFHGIYLYDTKKEVEIARLKVINKDNFILSRNKIVRQMLDSAVPKYNIIVKLSKT